MTTRYTPRTSAWQSRPMTQRQLHYLRGLAARKQMDPPTRSRLALRLSSFTAGEASKAISWLERQPALHFTPPQLPPRTRSTCKRCGRPLTSPRSRRAGYGPECESKLS